MKIDDILHKSALIAAHPDDEILWFSSIVDKVDQVVICFVHHDSRPVWTRGRLNSLQQYPLKTLSYFDLSASETLNGADWWNPAATDIGIEISNQRVSQEKYRYNFPVLQAKLRENLKNCRNVITHNPWGEYGHEDHVQLYRAVKSLQPEMGFTVWFDSYCSNKSLRFMAEYASGFGCESLQLDTNRQLAWDIAEIYKKNKCWTWYESYEWPETETFIRDDNADNKNKHFGRLFPFHMILIEMPEPPAPTPPKSFLGRVKRKVKSFRKIVK